MMMFDTMSLSSGPDPEGPGLGGHRGRVREGVYPLLLVGSGGLPLENFDILKRNGGF